MTQAKTAIASTTLTPIGEVYITPTNQAYATWRIGELREGRVVAVVDLSDAEIERAGLTGKVVPCRSEDANRLYL